MYNKEQSLTQNAMRGVDFTAPFKEITIDMLYDKLADNDGDAFDHHDHTDDMCCVNDERTGKQLIGIMGRDGTEYVLEFRVNKNGNREIWEND